MIFAGEKVRERELVITPDVDESVRPERFQVIALEAIVRMKLTSFRRKDQVHLTDMLEVGLIDATWPARFPPDLTAGCRC